MALSPPPYTTRMVSCATPFSVVLFVCEQIFYISDYIVRTGMRRYVYVFQPLSNRLQGNAATRTITHANIQLF